MENPESADCDIGNILGNDMKPFLVGANITGIVVIVAIGFLLIALVCLKRIPIIGIIIAIILNAIIALLWIIIAFEIFLNRGSPCIAHGITYFGYFIVLIVLSILTFCATR